MDRVCKFCKWYSDDLPPKTADPQLDHRWFNKTCTKEFPRGYIGRNPPHATMAHSSCFQFEERVEDLNYSFFEVN